MTSYTDENSQALRSLQCHDHPCSIYESQAELKSQFVPYLQAGLLLGDRCVYFVHDTSAEFVIDAMQEDGFDIKPYLKSRAFEVIHTSDAHLKGGFFDEHKMVSYWGTALAEARELGFSGLRAAVEMTWALSGLPGCDILAPYEARLNNFTRSNNVSVICQYSRQRFSAQKLKDIVHAHPLVVVADCVLDNPAHVKPEHFVESSHDLDLQATLDTLAMAKKLRQTNDQLIRSLEEQTRMQERLQDLEKERQKRELAQAREWQYRLIAEAIPQIVWTSNSDGEVEYLNGRWYQLTGMFPENSLGEGWLNVIHADDKERARKKWSEAIVSSKPFEETVRLRLGNDEYQWTLLRALPVRDDENNIDKWFGTGTDISKQKLLELELDASLSAEKAAKHELECFLENASEGLHWVDENGIIKWANPAELAMLGYTKEEYVGRHIGEFYVQQSAIDDVLSRLLKNETLNNYETQLRCKDGSIRTVLINSNVLWMNEKFVHTQCFTRDITDLKLAREALRESEALKLANERIERQLIQMESMNTDLRLAHEQALESSRLKSQFLANISHEIRTPMSGVICLSQLLVSNELAPESAALAEDIFTSAKNLMTIVNDLLDFSKIEAGKMVVSNEPFGVNEVIERVQKLTKALTTKKGLQLNVSVDPEIPGTVYGDIAFTEKTLLNLAHNATKFTSEGSITIAVSLEKQTDTECWVKFKVTDTGIGIPKRAHAGLYEPFVQADGSNTRRYGGTGIGLTMAKRLTELMSGEIGFSSEEGVGSEFWFILPYGLKKQHE